MLEKPERENWSILDSWHCILQSRVKCHYVAAWEFHLQCIFGMVTGGAVVQLCQDSVTPGKLTFPKSIFRPLSLRFFYPVFTNAFVVSIPFRRYKSLNITRKGSQAANLLPFYTKTIAICTGRLVWGFCRTIYLTHLKTLTMVAMETKVCHVIKLWTRFQKNLTVGC